MKFGAFLPYIIPTQIDRQTFLDWCRAIDAGPFGSLAHGERWAWTTLEHVTTLAAAAVATERVELWSHTFNVPMHPADFVAKRIATIDVLSGGRYTMVAGVGSRNREQDWLSAEKTPMRFPHARMDGQIEQIRRIWSGEPPVEGGQPIGPLPHQPGGPQIHCSAMGPKGLERATKWAAGFSGFIGPDVAGSPDACADYLAAEAKRVRDAWREAGRTDTPYLTTSCFFGLGPDARTRLGEIGASYLKRRLPDVSQQGFWVHDEAAVRLVIDASREAGFDHVIFIPTSAEVAELHLLADVLAQA